MEVAELFERHPYLPSFSLNDFPADPKPPKIFNIALGVSLVDGELFLCPQLFVNVLVSGIKILTMGHGLTRRTRFIAAMSLAVGLGVTIVPQFVNVSNDEVNFPNQGPLWPTRESWSPGFRGGFRAA